MTATFTDLKINESLIEGLKKQNIEEPTNIQFKAIPPALENQEAAKHWHICCQYFIRWTAANERCRRLYWHQLMNWSCKLTSK
ncbi:MAG: hypothetical protein K0Q99_834 [Clostridia bacterium]|nr:hypothetical protein [Clostridia bacterium]